MREKLQQTIAQWVEADAEARLIVGNDLRPHWVSPAAQRMLSEPDSPLCCNGRLRPRCPNLDHELKAVIATATEAGATHCLTDTRTGEHIVLRAIRVDEVVAITLHRGEHNAPIRLVDLRQAFGLTDAEHDVAEHLMNGHTAEETAALLGVGLETVRTHIKRAYAKLGVSSREAFLNRLRPFASSTMGRGPGKASKRRRSAYAPARDTGASPSDEGELCARKAAKGMASSARR
jgi:DNA-binding CsgD family transcriptional regulator